MNKLYSILFLLLAFNAIAMEEAHDPFLYYYLDHKDILSYRAVSTAWRDCAQEEFEKIFKKPLRKLNKILNTPHELVKGALRVDLKDLSDDALERLSPPMFSLPMALHYDLYKDHNDERLATLLTKVATAWPKAMVGAITLGGLPAKVDRFPIDISTWPSFSDVCALIIVPGILLINPSFATYIGEKFPNLQVIYSSHEDVFPGLRLLWSKEKDEETSSFAVIPQFIEIGFKKPN